MSNNIMGLVLLAGKEEPNAKVFISDHLGKITPKKIGVVTDKNGKYVLDITNKDGLYISASNYMGLLTTTMLKDDLNMYVLDLNVGKTTSIPEIKVTPPPKEPKEPIIPKVPVVPEVDKTKKTNWLIIGIVILGVIAAGTITYYFITKKK